MDKLINLHVFTISDIMKNGIKTIVVKNDTHDKLLNLRRRDETMNDIIIRLIDFYKHEKIWKIGE